VKLCMLLITCRTVLKEVVLWSDVAFLVLYAHIPHGPDCNSSVHSIFNFQTEVASQ